MTAARAALADFSVSVSAIVLKNDAASDFGNCTLNAVVLLYSSCYAIVLFLVANRDVDTQTDLSRPLLPQASARFPTSAMAIPGAQADGGDAEAGGVAAAAAAASLQSGSFMFSLSPSGSSDALQAQVQRTVGALSRLGVNVLGIAEVQIHESIGSGGYGEVFRGRWNGADVAVKRLTRGIVRRRRPQPDAGPESGTTGTTGTTRPTDQQRGGDASVAGTDRTGESRWTFSILGYEDSALEQFIGEVLVMQALRHPYIVMLLGISVTPDGHLCLVTEFCPNGSVYDMIHSENKHMLTQLLTAQVLLQTAGGMAYLHSRSPSIMHRDLKSQNILLDASWNAKCCDFGMSRDMFDKEATTRIGTPAW